MRIKRWKNDCDTDLKRRKMIAQQSSADLFFGAGVMRYLHAQQRWRRRWGKFTNGGMERTAGSEREEMMEDTAAKHSGFFDSLICRGFSITLLLVGAAAVVAVIYSVFR